MAGFYTEGDREKVGVFTPTFKVLRACSTLSNLTLCTH